MPISLASLIILKGFTILAVAEGAISKEDAALSKKELKEKKKNYKYPSVSYEVAERIQKKTGCEVLRHI